jgi:hypothetical protein
MICCRIKLFPFVTYYRHIPWSNISAFVSYYTHIRRSGLGALVNYYVHIPCSRQKVFMTLQTHFAFRSHHIPKRQTFFLTSFVKYSNIALRPLCLQLISYECLKLEILSSVNQNVYCSTQRLLSPNFSVVTCTAYRMPINRKHVD